MKKIYFLLVLLFPLFYSCDDNNPDNDNDRNVANAANQYVNDWIYEQMSTYYLWDSYIPSVLALNFNENPEDFFYSLLYKYKQTGGDRFSWIQENYVDLLSSLSGVSSYDIGFEYVGYLEAANSTNVIGQVAYVKPGTHAEQLGIKRGDAFTKVNGTQLTTSNWRSLFNSTSATVTFQKQNGEVTTTEQKNITLSVNYSENPVYLDTIYTEGANTVGYLVYNFFAADGGDGSQKYDLQLNEAFGRFKAASITHLVLDFRYNSGGSMNSATLLGSMIVPQLNTSNVFTKVQYNDFLNSYFTQRNGSDALLDKFQDKVKSVPINNVGDNLQELYVLTGSWTASASELIINNLEPYLPNKIYLIGLTTVGKNVGSVSLYEENDPKNKWGMQPIVLKYFNSNGLANFEEGFTPDIEERDNYLYGKLELGDRDEVMLSIALGVINGTYSRPSVSRQAVDAGYQPVGASVEGKAWANQVIVDPERFNITNK